MPGPFKKLLVANRSEIAIRVFRSAHELGLRTVAIYSHEDRFALHRFKADEAYRVGRAGEPIRAYLDIPGIVGLAKEVGADAVHPGYGFLSENAGFARACAGAGITFVGPKPEVLDQLGDKVAARRIAQQAKVPTLGGSDRPVSAADAAAVAEVLGYPVIVKASMGGGGRGMRVVRDPAKLTEAVESAGREAGAAFGVADVFLEKFVERAKHIEVQLLGDRHGGLVHLFERDCSIQRRHQKVVELAPAPNLPAATRDGILEAALKVGRAVGIDNASTVEFLVDADTGAFYFIEVNPRIQVEHTVTEVVTGYDIVKSQILIAGGTKLGDPDVGLGDQAAIRTTGFAIQCRVTTEDPANAFTPDYGRLTAYRSAGGLGVRLDAGTAFGGAVITPFYDSLLVKVTTNGNRFVDAARRMERCLQEFRVRGVKTNLPFLLNLIVHPQFLDGTVTTRFLDETPDLFKLPARQDRATRLLNYVAEVIVNGHPEVKRKPDRLDRSWVGTEVTRRPPASEIPPGTRTRLQQVGPDKFAAWVRDQKRLLVTDTTMRDAHQSLLATRMRTFDMLAVADRYARHHADLFSLEMWGGATFDTAMRFLKEDPWERLVRLRERVPNVLFQMLLRGSSAVGYTNYPDNLVTAFVREAGAAGMDVFRVFDACNYLPNLRPAIEAVRTETRGLAEACVCYTGDILDPRRDKYTLDYFVGFAKELEKAGAHLLAVKDMAGLLKPYAAKRLVKALKESVGLAVHFHTHDAAGGQLASYLQAAEEGVDVVDAAFAPLSGNTSQPSLNALAESLRFTDLDPGFDFDALQETARYWEAVRRQYAPFESDQFPNADVYQHEMPGGQATNLQQQAKSLGLGDRWPDVCRTYAAVNQLFGDIIKVTPTSKVVGDLALFMLANNLTAADVADPSKDVSFPESVVEFFEGRLGVPPGGFPAALQKKVLRGRPALAERAGASLPPADLPGAKAALKEKYQREPTDRNVLSHLLYGKVFADFVDHRRRFADVSVLPTPVFFYGLEKGDEVSLEIEPGKTLVVKFLAVGDPQPDGRRQVFFELNGQPREVQVEDRSLGGGTAPRRVKAEAGNLKQVAAPMPGAVVAVAVSAGEAVAAGAKLLTLEAMKMETTLYAERDGTVAEVLAKPGTQVEGGDLLVRLE
jgi:pyruvate carboxylase